ncbi:carboxypeptidase-like regulatory domain-containing protein [Aquimarina pacifica]|uniref:carboxypeptidase-like regulatory domain-containing protein n=1 Tax=Aquimarina pacifica TaxID=1296415 RepID=UPI00046E7E10|nr:carboxypeptidase-like regulatory domain-containing protein [Aquimarina pacifica]
MNNQISIKIKTPCSENFDNFSSTQKGGFCDSCKKEVIDFTKMNSQEIINHIQLSKTQNTCGRFNIDQLTTYTNIPPEKRKLRLISKLGIAFIALFSFCKVHAQNIKIPTKELGKNPTKIQDSIQEKNIVVKGTVNENGTPLPGANVILEGTNIGVTTDFDGNFKFPEKLKKGDVLVFSYVGMNAKKVVIQDKNSAQDITLQVNLKMDSCVLMGKVAVKKVYTSKKGGN